MDMYKILNIIKDIIKAIIVGLVISFILIVVSALGATLIKRGGTKITLEVIRSTLFIIGSLGLILFSGFILKKDARRSLRNNWKWRKQFQVINFIHVLLIIDIMILSSGIVIDNIRFYM